MAYTDLQIRAFTQIAYMDLDKKYTDLCIKNETNRIPLTELLNEKQYDMLRKLHISEKEIETWSIVGIHDKNPENGFYACILETGTGEAAVAFRGSEGMGKLENVVNDWVKADFGLLNSTCTNQQQEAAIFLEKYGKQLKAYNSIALAGHSLGGNLAEYAAIVSYKYGLQDKITQCVSMDGPGFSQEFIDKYRDSIEKMAGVMEHPRWSLVGGLLMDLPGVRYRYVSVSNDANELDDKKYGPASRHDTKYLVFDENGCLVSGEQDNLSKIVSLISKDVEILPAPLGNAYIALISGALVGFAWMKEDFFTKDGRISEKGWQIIVGTVGVGCAVGFGTMVCAAAAVILVIAAVIVDVLIYEFILQTVDTICEALAQFYNWTGEQFQEFREMLKTCIDKVKGWFKSNFDEGYRYAGHHPQICVDTLNLRNYAQRIQAVNQRIQGLDGRLDALYWQVGLQDLWSLLQADLLTGYSWRLQQCATYLNDTASDFELVERRLLNEG